MSQARPDSGPGLGSAPGQALAPDQASPLLDARSGERRRGKFPSLTGVETSGLRGSNVDLALSNLALEKAHTKRLPTRTVAPVMTTRGEQCADHRGQTRVVGRSGMH